MSDQPVVEFDNITIDVWKQELADRYGMVVVNEEATNKHFYFATKKVSGKHKRIGRYDRRNAKGHIVDRRAGVRDETDTNAKKILAELELEFI